MKKSYKLGIRGPGYTNQKYIGIFDSQTDAQFRLESDASGNTNMGLYNHSGFIRVKLNSSGDSYFNGGNLGVGTTTPDELLDIDGTTQMTGFKLTTAPTTGHVLTSDGDGVGTWQAPTAGSDSDWEISGDNIYSAVSGNVGIGETSPTAKLHVTGNDGVLFEGTYNSGTAVNLGAGTRMMWYPKKAAFRAGRVHGTEWNDGNIGGYSTAMGYSTTASGDYSTAMGSWTIASGEYSTAMGDETNAESYASVALGRFNVGGGTAISWEATDPLFEIGNGADGFNRANALTILKNGNVGIGKANPARLLHVDGEMEVDGAIYADDATGVGFLDDAGNLGLWVEDGGQVGIGTDTPGANLDIRSADASSALIIANNSGVNRFALNPNSDGSWTMFDNAAGAWYGGITQQSGNVGIGTTTPGSYRLNVNGGNAYFSNDVSALSFTDRTPYPKDLETAYSAVLSMQRLPEGEYDENNKENQLDHSKLHSFVKSQDGEHRDLSAVVSAQNEVIKDLLKRLEKLEQLIKKEE